jgi:hypothetical protein
LEITDFGSLMNAVIADGNGSSIATHPRLSAAKIDILAASQTGQWLHG